MKYAALICQMGHDRNACLQWLANSGWGCRRGLASARGTGGSGSPSGVSPLRDGSSCRKRKPAGAPAPGSSRPARPRPSRQSISAIRNAAKGTRIRRPATYPMRSVRLPSATAAKPLAEHRAGVGQRRTALTDGSHHAKHPDQVPHTAGQRHHHRETPIMVMPVITTMRTPTRVEEIAHEGLRYTVEEQRPGRQPRNRGCGPRRDSASIGTTNAPKALRVPIVKKAINLQVATTYHP